MAAKTVSEKVKSAPKELARRGLESGVDRLRGQLRDAAQQLSLIHISEPTRP